MAAKTSVEYQLFATGRFGSRGNGSSCPPLGVGDLGRSPSNAKTPTPSSWARTRGVQNRVDRTSPRTQGSIQDASLAPPAPTPPQTPKVALTTRTRGRRGAAQSSREPSRPVPRRPRHVPEAATPQQGKNRAGKRRDHRLTAHTDHFLAVEGRATNAAERACPSPEPHQEMLARLALALLALVTLPACEMGKLEVAAVR